MFETVFFLECLGMSQPLDSAMSARPPKVPFSGGKGMLLCFWVKKIVPVDITLGCDLVGNLRRFTDTDEQSGTS
jgi:hypothetical protein